MKQIFHCALFAPACCGLALMALYVFSLGSMAALPHPARDVQEPRVIRNPRDPVPPEGQRKRVVFTEELTIGEAEGDENTMFGNSIQVNTDSHGNIYVLDWDRKHIKAYAPDGAFLRAVGKQGQGPGEFGNIWSHRFDKEGNLYATDIVNKRVSFFRPDGQFLKQARIPENAGGVAILSDGNYLTTKTELKEGPEGADYTYVHGIYSPDFTLLTELNREYQSFSPRGNRSMGEFVAEILSRSAYRPNFLSEISSDGLIYAGFTAEYRITVYDSAGKPLKIILKDHEPVRIAEKHKRTYFENQVTSFLRGRMASLEDEVRKNLKYPKNLPAFHRFVLLDNGWLFVVTQSLVDEPALVDLFDAEGTYVGRFTTDVPCDFLMFRGEKAYAVSQVDGYNYVKKYGFTIENY